MKVGQFTSNSITLNVGAPQGCVLSPLLYSVYSHDCVFSHSSTSIVKFADDTVVLGLISNNDETAYLDEVERLTSWCQDNCLSLKVSKTKALIVERQEETAAALHSSYDQWDPCGEDEQLQEPWCKHLQGPDLFGAFPLHGTARYGTVRFTFGGFSTGTVPGTWYFFSTTSVEVPSSRTVTKTWRVNSADHWLAGENRHYCVTELATRDPL